jgi:hypothetical protein
MPRPESSTFSLNRDGLPRLLSVESSLVREGIEAYCGWEMRISGDAGRYKYCGV